MTANPVHVGRILDHASDWCWLRLDRAAAALQPGDIIRVRPVNEEWPFRTGECRVLDTFDDFVHVERGAWMDIVAIADMDHVYLTERRRPYAPSEKMTDRHPDSVIAQVVEETIAADPTLRPVQRCGIGSTHHDHRCERPAGHVGVHVGRGCSWGDDAVEKLPGGGSSTFNAPWSPPVICEHPGYNAVFHIEPDPPDLAQRQAECVAEHQRREQERIAAVSVRPDGFDRSQVDAAKAALLAPAPPRYPRTR